MTLSFIAGQHPTYKHEEQEKPAPSLEACSHWEEPTVILADWNYIIVAICAQEVPLLCMMMSAESLREVKKNVLNLSVVKSGGWSQPSSPTQLCTGFRLESLPNSLPATPWSLFPGPLMNYGPLLCLS